MSQRSDNFNGGRKPATARTDAPALPAVAISVEPALRQATKNLRQTLCRSDPTLLWRPTLPSDRLSDLLSVERGHISGMKPDGGVWFERGSNKPLVIAEAKKQGVAGNAIERWYKNYAIAHALECGVYLSLCSGEGFFTAQRPQAALELALALDPNERHRLEHGSVWNRPLGRIWVYRYKDAASAPVATIESLLVSAINHARAARNAQ